MITRDPYYTPPQNNPDIGLTGIQYEYNPDAMYGEHIINTAAICNTSATHTYGHVMATVEKWLLSDIFSEKHPGDIFKTVIASTTLASRQLSHLPNQMRKKEFPIMVLTPRIIFGQDNRFLGNTLFNSRVTDTQSFWGDGQLVQLAEDRKHQLYTHGHFNRALMYIDVVISFNTNAEQTNMLSYLYNTACVNHNKFITAPLELYIPEDLCELIGNLVGVPVREKDSVSDFLTYMNSTWFHPITYKLKGGSNSDEFFMYYIADIDTVIQDIDKNNGIKDGQIRRAFDISFTVRCEFNTIGYFTLNSPSITHSINIPDRNPNAAIVPIFSDVIDLDDFSLPIGWSILCWPIFKLAYNENSISFDNILNQSLRVVIDYHLKMKLPMERFIMIQFRENGSILNDEMYYIDWKNRMIVLAHPNMRRTYRLIVTVSHDYINNLIKEMYNLE